MSPGDIPAALANHAFEHLFIECLGWDRLRAHVVVQHDGMSLELAAVAQKRGFAAFVCPAHRTILANRRMLRDIQRQLRKSYHEHILIHYCETPLKQVWQWSTLVDGKRHVQHREHPFFSNEPPPRLLERLRGLSVSFQEEEGLTLTDVLSRVRLALQPDADYDLFAKYPKYAAKSDRLAMAIKNGEPGALQKFVEFHMPLARYGSRQAVRWFGMEPDDAEQTAMIGLIQAARRFDPDRGYQFSTYATYWIRQACQRLGLEWGLPIHVPVHYFWTCLKLSFEEPRLIATYGASAAREHFERMQLEAGVTPQQWRHFYLARHLSLFSEIDKRELAKADRPDDSVSDEESGFDRVEVERALQTLHPRQSRILRMRYGFGQPVHTLQEIADTLHLTRERIRQIQEKAERKLVRFLREAGSYGEYDPEPEGNEEPEVEEMETCT